MSIDLRLNKLMPALSARERAILILESWKAGDEEDPLWRSTMQPGQSAEFNRLIGLMNGSVISLGNYIMVTEQLVEKMELRQCWLVALKLWDTVGGARCGPHTEPVWGGETDWRKASQAPD